MSDSVRELVEAGDVLCQLASRFEDRLNVPQVRKRMQDALAGAGELLKKQEECKHVHNVTRPSLLYCPKCGKFLDLKVDRP